MNLCRLCGEEKSSLDFNIELNDKTSSSWSYRELIEHHTRVSLPTNKLLPQCICEECRGKIDEFAEFSKQLEATQNTFDFKDEEQLDPPEFKECFVELDEVFSGANESDKEDELFDCDVPVTKRPRKSRNVEKSDKKTVEEFFNEQFPDIPSLNLHLDILYDTDQAPNGEIPESVLKDLNLPRWSELNRSCMLCKAPVNNLMELQSHHEAVHNVRDVEILCYFCDDTLKSVFGYTNHMTIKHPEVEHLKHCCLMCDKIYSNLEFLQKHVKSEHSECRTFFQCYFCGRVFDTFTTMQKHSQKHLKRDAKTANMKKRCTIETETVEQTSRTKRHKSDKLFVKVEDESASEKEMFESESDYQEPSSSDEKPTRRSRKREVKSYGAQRRANNSPRIIQLSIFGPEIDTFEKLYDEELNGTSNQFVLHLNVSESCKLPSGEIPEEHAVQLNPLRWRDLLICGICKIKFTNINDMFDHADDKHSMRSKLFHCHNCDSDFTTLCESTLVNHLVERHYYEHLKFCCMVCSKLFYNFSSLLNHYKTHEGKCELLVCLICGWYAKTLEDLKEHKAFHMRIEKSENQLLCERVFDKFSSGAEPSVRNHCVAEYEKNSDGTVKDDCQVRFAIDWSFGNYQCPACVVNFPNPFELFVHQRLMHPKDFFKKIYSCSLCTDKKDYSNLFTFINHATSKHLDDAKFTCIVCAKVFWNYLALAKHYKNVHPTLPCVFCCHCGKIFMNVTVAASHFKALNLLRTPEERKLLKEGKIQEETSHICHVCARNFKSRGTLLNHVKTHEVLEPSDLLQCHICSKFYKNKYKLAQHMVCHEDLRSWKCKTCGQAFNYKKLLQRHIQAVHENERPFGCTFCEKRFNSKYDLTVHVRLHTGEFPYECPVQDCDAKYPAWSNLFKHCQSRHKLDIRSEGYKKLKATQKTPKNADEYESD